MIHALCAAADVAEMRLDRDTLIAALLHDVLEDTSVNAEELTKTFWLCCRYVGGWCDETREAPL